MKPEQRKQPAPLSRRLLLLFGSLVLFYPLLRYIRFRLPRKPKIIEIHRPIKQDGQLLQDDLILFSREKSVWAVSRVCTHLGCRLNFKESEGYLECPCHQSRFTINGRVLHGPAKRDLTRYPVEQKGDPPVLYVTIR